MLKILLTQTGWNILGTLFGFIVGFFVKLYVINKVGAASFGLYVIATSFEVAVGTVVAFGIPFIILKFLPTYIAKGNTLKATVFTSTFLFIILLLGIISCILIFIFSDVIAINVFHKAELKAFFKIIAFYIPVSLLVSYIIAIYRSIFKIKEIILYHTFVLVSIRAILAFIIFSFTNDIKYFLYIEIISMSIALFLLVINLKTDKFVFSFKFISKKVINKEIIKYGKVIYFNSLLGFFSGYVITFIMSVILAAKIIGIYSVLLTIAGLTNFLLSNINRVFSPIISHLIAVKDMKTFSKIYKDSTFFINILTIPFILIILLFGKKILSLYGSEFATHTFELMILFLGNYFSISVGSSGTIMLMAGLEKEEVYIQLVKIIFVVILSLIFLPIYGLLGAVIIYAISTFFVNFMEVYLINKKLHVFPLDKDSIVLFLLFFIGLIIANMYQNKNFHAFEYIFYPLIIYGIFFLIFRNKIMNIVKDIKKEKN